MILALAATAHAGLEDCSQGQPIAGTAGFANARDALQTNRDTYSASAFAERHVFQQIAAGDQGDVAKFAADTNITFGASRLPVYNDGALYVDADADCPAEALIMTAPLDLQAENLGFAFRAGNFGGFYAASVTFGQLAESSNYVRALTWGFAYPMYAMTLLSLAPIAGGWQRRRRGQRGDGRHRTVRPGDLDLPVLNGGFDPGRVVGETIGLPVGAEPRTVELWMSQGTTPYGERHAVSYGTSQPERAAIVGASSGAVAFTQLAGAVVGPYVFGAFHHVAVTYDGADVSLYADGVAVAGPTPSRSTRRGAPSSSSATGRPTLRSRARSSAPSTTSASGGSSARPTRSRAGGGGRSTRPTRTSRCGSTSRWQARVPGSSSPTAPRTPSTASPSATPAPPRTSGPARDRLAPMRRPVGSTAVLFAAAVARAAPADALPTPRPEPCIPFDADPEEGGIATPQGLSYDEVRPALGAVIQHALKCGQPEGLTEVHLTFELLVGCDGVVAKVDTVDDGGAPAAYVACVSAVVAKADFPAHDMKDGMPVTYPVDVSWKPR